MAASPCFVLFVYVYGRIHFLAGALVEYTPGRRFGSRPSEASNVANSLSSSVSLISARPQMEVFFGTSILPQSWSAK